MIVMGSKCHIFTVYYLCCNRAENEHVAALACTAIPLQSLSTFYNAKTHISFCPIRECREIWGNVRLGEKIGSGRVKVGCMNTFTPFSIGFDIGAE